ncbi:MAG: lipase family protein [Bifidobacteriaceae bacterium]|jgi:pimeloyl-ACP methyl ester carboxylesterase|nr:lipase family protein [Bifidobacteriaceae bacterium]
MVTILSRNAGVFRFIAFAAVIALMAFSFSGCSNNSGTESGATSDDTAVTDTTDYSFYEYDGELPTAPGKLLKTEPWTSDSLPAGARGFKILYTTTISPADGDASASKIGLASGFVIAQAENAEKPQDIVAWAHGTSGVARRCAPTILGNELFGVPAQEVYDKGWVLVGTDYYGMGTDEPNPYLAGVGEAHSMLDAVRAAKEMSELSLSGKTVVWGHSQGGGTAIWTGIEAATYAPDVDLVGVVGEAPATDSIGLLGSLDVIGEGRIVSAYTIWAFDKLYSDVSFEEYIADGASDWAKAAAETCIIEEFTDFPEGVESLWKKDPLTGAFGERVRENIPVWTADVPLFVAQGEADTLVPASMQDKWIETQKAAGKTMWYEKYPDATHVGLVLETPKFNEDLIKFTTARFNGEEFLVAY